MSGRTYLIGTIITFALLSLGAWLGNSSLSSFQDDMGWAIILSIGWPVMTILLGVMLLTIGISEAFGWLGALVWHLAGRP